MAIKRNNELMFFYRNILYINTQTQRCSSRGLEISDEHRNVPLDWIWVLVGLSLVWVLSQTLT